MSAYSTTQTQFTEPELLLAALREMGYQPLDCIAAPRPLEGYQGDYRTADGSGHTRKASEAMTAHVIIPRGQVGGAANDIGFVLGPDGKFSGIYSAYDRRVHATETWRERLAGEYGKQKVMREAKRAGLRLTGQNKIDGKIQYTFCKA